MKIKQLITFLFVISIIFSCTKDEPMVEPLKEVPKVTTKVSENLTHNSVTLVGEVNSEGTSSVTEQGFYYIEEGTSTEIKVIFSTNGIGIYKADLSQLKPNTTYQYYAYAKNSIGVSESINKHAFITQKDPRYSSENIILKTQAEVDDFAKR